MLGKLQKRVRRAFLAHPGGLLTTGDLVRWCYPRLTGEVQNKHRYRVRTAADRIAERVGRTYPGGFIWRAKASQLLPRSQQRETKSQN